MNCPPELSLMMHVDRELAPSEAVAIDRHLATCERCRARVVVLRDEAAVLVAALAHDPVTVDVPAFERPITAKGVLVGAVVTALLATLLSSARNMVGLAVPDVLRWFNPIDAGGITKLIVNTGILLAERGDAILASVAETVGSGVVLIGLIWLAAVVGRRIRGPFVMASIACAVALHPTPSHALEIRHVDKGPVFVAADERIDDTLIAIGETVEVNGNVNGDLIAFGKRVVVRGQVAGFVITGAQDLTLDGTVDGSVLAGAETLGVSGKIGRNLFAGGETVTVADGAEIEQNALVGGERVNLAGRIGRDVLGGAEELEVASTIGGALSAHTERMTLLAPARIGGDVRAYGLERKDHVTVSPGAVIGGQLVTELEKLPNRENRYLTGAFYGWQLLWWIAAFLTGLVLFWVVPGLRWVALDGGADALRASAYGSVALVATPILAILACVTLIGLPLGVIALMAWIAAIYLAKVVVAQVVGNYVFDAVVQRREHFAVSLAVGLLIVIVATHLPFVGGLIGAVVTLLGFGLLVMFVREELRDDPDGEPA